eukprot:5816489-Amphidinium_carterae.1
MDLEHRVLPGVCTPLANAEAHGSEMPDEPAQSDEFELTQDGVELRCEVDVEEQSGNEASVLDKTHEEVVLRECSEREDAEGSAPSSEDCQKSGCISSCNEKGLLA